MHKANIILILFLVLLLNACKANKQQQTTSNAATIENSYLNQTLPGLIPEMFAPGLVSTDNWEVGGVFTPDLKEFYFLREIGEKEEDLKQVFMMIEQKDNGNWEESQISGRVGQAFISPDGKIMHLGRRYKVRTDSGWSEIKRLGAPYDTIPIMRMTSSAKGTYAFDEAVEGRSILRYSRLINGKREEPKPFPKEINTGKHNAHPFIAPDESYVLWDGQRDNGPRNAEIYVSFKQPNGTWGQAIKLGKEINTKASEFGARVTPDGKYLFFNRNTGKVKPTDKYENTDIFWVDAKVIETLRPKE